VILKEIPIIKKILPFSLYQIHQHQGFKNLTVKEKTVKTNNGMYGVI